MSTVKTVFSINLLAALVMVIGYTTAASAHGIWLAQRHGTYAIVYGHGASDEAYKPEKLTMLEARNAKGATTTVEKKVEADHVLVAPAENGAIIIGRFDNGYWSKDNAGKWHNLPKDAVTGAVEGGRYLKSMVALLAPSNIVGTPQGLDLEIVPLVDPMTLKAGDELPVQVLAHGKPAADVVVIAEYTTDSENKTIRTDKDGKATIKVRNQGLNVVAASWSEAPQDTIKADKIGHLATLSFNLDYHTH